MFLFLKKLWKDPVFSNIIATGITVAIAWIGAYIYGGIKMANVFDQFYKGLFAPLIVPVWVIISLSL